MIVEGDIGQAVSQDGKEESGMANEPALGFCQLVLASEGLFIQIEAW